MAIKPGKFNPLKPDIELFDYKSKKRFGLKLDGIGGLQIGTISQDDSVHVRSAGKRVGDFDEQRSWKGGRGIDKLTDNAEGYWDSQNAWTMSEGHLHQTLLWQHAKGLRSCDFNLPSAINPASSTSMGWHSLTGSNRYLSMSWTSTGFVADYARVWIRKVGSPGTLTIRILADSGGEPGAILKSAAITASNVSDVLSVFYKFDWTTTETLVNGTRYHIQAEAASTDNASNRWYIGGNRDGSSGLVSASGGSGSWEGIDFDMYFYVADADQNRTFFTFFLDEAMYVVSKPDLTASTSSLYINGDRGKATSATASTLVHASKSWTTDKWAYARVKIIRGTGFGQTRQIASNTGNTLTLNTDWDVTPSTDSEYIIYSTPWFTEITGHGLGRVSSAPAVVNQIVYFPQDTTTMRNMVWNASTVAHVFAADGTNTASFLIPISVGDGIQIWRGLNQSGTSGKTISYASAVAYSATPTALTFSTSRNVGDSTYIITNMIESEGVLYVFKENGIWKVSTNSSGAPIVRLQNGIEKTPSKMNGRSALVHQQFVFYSWLHSLVRIYASSHDDVGQDWSGYGLPDGREGEFASLDSYTSLLIAAVDAGTDGTSSVLGFDGLGWHELLRAYDSGRRVRMVKVQPVEDARNMLWIDVGGDLIYQRFPKMKGSPRLDSGVRYHHEAVVESSAIDMGTASALPKFIKELTVICDNIGKETRNEIFVDYQVDDDVHTSNWTEATSLHQTPEATAFLGLSDIRKFAYRIRILARDNSLPVDVQGVIPNGYARSPFKMVWTLRCKADNVTSRGRIVKPDQLMRWLLDNARFPGRLEMKSQYELAHGFFVIVHPPRMFPYKPAQNGQAEESVFTLVLEEA